MRRWMWVLLVGVGLAAGARAEGAVSAVDGAAIRRVIGAQIEAFRHDDGDAAFGFAAPGIQTKFGDAAHFLSAVRAAYPLVYRPRSFSFGLASDEGGVVEQRVEVVGPDGAMGVASYDMEREADGGWRIAGCRMEKVQEALFFEKNNQKTFASAVADSFG